MEWVHRFLKSGLGGDPRDNIRALDSIRGYRMKEDEADSWMSVLSGANREAGVPC
jgi:hypothetical protein